MARAKKHIFPKDVREVAELGTALGHPARVEVLCYLAEHGESSAARLFGLLPLSRQACSAHLAALRTAKLVRIREHGPRSFYSINRRRLRALSKAWDCGIAGLRDL